MYGLSFLAPFFQDFWDFISSLKDFSSKDMREIYITLEKTCTISLSSPYIFILPVQNNVLLKSRGNICTFLQ